MQKLKPEIKDLILKSAESIFYKEGYREATTRKIADYCNISVSNLYLYFKNKEDIFKAVIFSFYNEFNRGLNSFLDHVDDKSSFNGRIEQLTSMFFNIISEDRKKFIILFAKSAGTAFENYKSKVVNIIMVHIKRQLTSDVNQEVVKIISNNFFNSIIEVAIISKKNIDLKNNIYSVIVYHMQGIKCFI